MSKKVLIGLLTGALGFFGCGSKGDVVSPTASTSTAPTMSVIAGSGLTGGGSGESVTLDVGAGTGISVTEDLVGIAPGGVSSTEIADGTIGNADVNETAAIAGTKINPNFGAQAITTSGDIVTTGGGVSVTGDISAGGDINAAGDLSAAGGFKMMIGPFAETNVDKSTEKSWKIGTEGNDIGYVWLPWSGSVMGVSVHCSFALSGDDKTAKSALVVEPVINATKTGLKASLDGGKFWASATAEKDVPTHTFSAGDLLSCKGTTTAAFGPTFAECVCIIFVEM